MKETRGWKLLLLAAAIVAAGLALVRPAVHAGIALRRARAEREAALHPWTGLQTLQADSALLYYSSTFDGMQRDMRILTGETVAQLMEILERGTGAKWTWLTREEFPSGETEAFRFSVDFFFEGKNVADVSIGGDSLSAYLWDSHDEDSGGSWKFSDDARQELSALHAAAPQLADLIADAPEDAQASFTDYSGEAPLPSPAAQTAAEAAHAALAAAQPYEEGRGVFLAPRTVLTLRYPDYTVKLVEYERVPMHLLRVEVSLFGGEDGWPSGTWLQLRPEDGIVRRLGLQTDETD